MKEYLKYPRTVKDLAAILKEIIDDYWNKEITEEELFHHLEFYAKKNKEKVYTGRTYNKTLTLILGKKRTIVLKKVIKEVKEEDNN